MIWLDSVMAVPAIGLRIKTNFKYVSEYRQRLEHFIQQLREEYEDVFIGAVEVWGYSLNVKGDGYNFNLTHKNILVGYSYVITQTPQAGKLPILELPNIRTFSELFKVSYKYLQDILDAIESVSDIYFDRIGIVAEVDLEKDSLPPALTKWIEHIGKPWDNKLTDVQWRLTAKLHEEKLYYERCHHQLIFVQDEVVKTGFKIKLDWQRVLNKPALLKPKEALKQLDTCKEKAYEYFQKFGEGGLSYE